MGRAIKWSEEEDAILRENWFLGWTDAAIGALLNRTETAVEARRGDLHLTMKFHQPSARAAKLKRTYSDEDDERILARHNAGESPTIIAHDYNVHRRTMVGKIERLIERQAKQQELEQRQKAEEPTGRGCLWCGVWFFSKLPRSVNRRCSTCAETAEDAVSLTVYSTPFSNL